jgi:hypothetical protein
MVFQKYMVFSSYDLEKPWFQKKTMVLKNFENEGTCIP